MSVIIPLSIQNQLHKLSKRYKVTMDYMLEQFNKGYQVEKEHSYQFKKLGFKGAKLVEQISTVVLTHLKESKLYYIKLDKMESTFKLGGGIEKTNDGTKGGLLSGDSHEAKSGGISAVVTDDNNRPVLLEGSEVIIKKESAEADGLHTLDGKPMSNKAILSEINQDKGGVPIMDNGGSIFNDGGVEILDNGSEIKKTSEIDVSHTVHDGKKEVKAGEIQIAYITGDNKYKDINIEGSDDSHKVFRDFISKNTIDLQESFLVIFLNPKNEVIGINEMFKGGIDKTVVDVRILFSVALKMMATAMIICHNHPQGELKATLADLKMVERIKNIGKYLEIKLIDSLIMNKDGYTLVEPAKKMNKGGKIYSDYDFESNAPIEDSILIQEINTGYQRKNIKSFNKAVIKLADYGDFKNKKGDTLKFRKFDYSYSVTIIPKDGEKAVLNMNENQLKNFLYTEGYIDDIDKFDGGGGVGKLADNKKTLYHISENLFTKFDKVHTGEIGFHFFENKNDCFNYLNRGHIYTCEVDLGNVQFVETDMNKWDKDSVDRNIFEAFKLSLEKVDAIKYTNRKEQNWNTEKQRFDECFSYIVRDENNIKIKSIEFCVNPKLDKFDGGGEIEDAKMKYIKYIGISKKESIKFKKPTYVLNYKKEGDLIVGQTANYGYLTMSYTLGSPRGWAIDKLSMFPEDFEKRFDLKEGVVKLNIDTSELQETENASNKEYKSYNNIDLTNQEILNSNLISEDELIELCKQADLENKTLTADVDESDVELYKSMGFKIKK